MSLFTQHWKRLRADRRSSDPDVTDNVQEEYVGILEGLHDEVLKIR